MFRWRSNGLVVLVVFSRILRKFILSLNLHSDFHCDWQMSDITVLFF